MPDFPAIHHVALTVRDLSVSVPWYERLTGTQPVLDEDTGPFRHVVFALGGTLLGLHQFPGDTPIGEFDPQRPGLDHVSFGVAHRDLLEKWAERLDELGIPHGDIMEAGYGIGLSFKDPDGLPLEFFAPPV